jgi:hypothetical protein
LLGLLQDRKTTRQAGEAKKAHYQRLEAFRWLIYAVVGAAVLVLAVGWVVVFLSP